MALFSAEHLTMRFGGLTAVDDFSLALEPRDLVGLIGPNGAGKTTVFNMISGMLQPTGGKIFFQGEEITGLKPNAVTRKGVARTFQNIRLFQDLKVMENVMISYHGRLRSSFLGAVLGTPLYRREESEMRDGAMMLLRQVYLEEMAEAKAGALSYGQQRRLEIARALATKPSLLLLDEPAAGMNPQETEELMDFILQVKEDFGLTILLIEHDMRVVMGICQWIKVLDYGADDCRGNAPGDPEQPPGHCRLSGRRRRRERVLLEVSGLCVFYGGIHALKEISLSVPEGKIITLIGANGAGKSTTLRAISGLVEARQGKDSFPGPGDSKSARPSHCPGWESAMVPEGRRIFVNLSVEENLLMGAYSERPGRKIQPESGGGLQTLSPPERADRRRRGEPSRAGNSRCWPWAGD